jgi:hypothetical protein
MRRLVELWESVMHYALQTGLIQKRTGYPMNWTVGWKSVAPSTVKVASRISLRINLMVTMVEGATLFHPTT